MKKFINLVIFILCLGQLSFAQQNRKFERVKDSIFIIDKGKRFVVDKNVVTVNPLARTFRPCAISANK